MVDALDTATSCAKLDTETMEPERALRFSPAASHVLVTKVMASPVVTVAPDLEILALMRLFVTAGIGGAPVVDANGNPIGVVSKTDLLRELYDQPASLTEGSNDGPAEADAEADEDAAGPLHVRDIMTAGAVVVSESVSLAHAASVMAREHLHRVFVVNQAGAVTGVLSSSDIVQWLAREGEDAQTTSS